MTRFQNLLLLPVFEVTPKIFAFFEREKKKRWNYPSWFFSRMRQTRSPIWRYYIKDHLIMMNVSQSVLVSSYWRMFYFHNEFWKVHFQVQHAIDIYIFKWLGLLLTLERNFPIREASLSIFISMQSKFWLWLKTVFFRLRPVCRSISCFFDLFSPQSPHDKVSCPILLQAKKIYFVIMKKYF